MVSRSVSAHSARSISGLIIAPSDICRASARRWSIRGGRAFNRSCSRTSCFTEQHIHKITIAGKRLREIIQSMRSDIQIVLAGVLPLTANGSLELRKEPPFRVLTPGWAAVATTRP